jgi:ComF family protein
MAASASEAQVRVSKREQRVLRRAVASFLEAVDALVFPWECSVCGVGVVGGPFCGDCRRTLLEAAGSACPRCALPLGPWARRDRGCSECRGAPLGFDGAIALGAYQGPIRQLCLSLKDERNAWLARWMIDLLIEARPELGQVPRNAWVVPVPLHWRRHWQRGYNQSDELARRLARRLGLRRLGALRRVVATVPLATLGRMERARVMHDAFQVRAGSGPALEGRTVVLVDDILTTGATTGAAARTLKKAGAARVVVVVVGRAQGTT